MVANFECNMLVTVVRKKSVDVHPHHSSREVDDEDHILEAALVAILDHTDDADLHVSVAVLRIAIRTAIVVIVTAIRPHEGRIVISLAAEVEIVMMVIMNHQDVKMIKRAVLREAVHLVLVPMIVIVAEVVPTELLKHVEC